MDQKPMQTATGASWRDSKNVCALADGDRHLGHIIRAGDGWIAFDATHMADLSAAFRPLGFFPTMATAKDAVQSATAPLARSAAVV
jgi:hypothetical protein